MVDALAQQAVPVVAVRASEMRFLWKYASRGCRLSNVNGDFGANR